MFDILLYFIYIITGAKPMENLQLKLKNPTSTTTTTTTTITTTINDNNSDYPITELPSTTDFNSSSSESIPISPAKPQKITKQQEKENLKNQKELYAKQLRASLLNDYLTQKEEQQKQQPPIMKTEQRNTRIEKLQQAKKEIEQQTLQQEQEALKREQQEAQQLRSVMPRQAKVSHLLQTLCINIYYG